MNFDNRRNTYYINDQNEYESELLTQLYMLI